MGWVQWPFLIGLLVVDIDMLKKLSSFSFKCSGKSSFLFASSMSLWIAAFNSSVKHRTHNSRTESLSYYQLSVYRSLNQELGCVCSHQRCKCVAVSLKILWLFPIASMLMTYFNGKEFPQTQDIIFTFNPVIRLLVKSDLTLGKWVLGALKLPLKD